MEPNSIRFNPHSGEKFPEFHPPCLASASLHSTPLILCTEIFIFLLKEKTFFLLSSSSWLTHKIIKIVVPGEAKAELPVEENFRKFRFPLFDRTAI